MSFLKDYRQFLNYNVDRCGDVYININNNENSLYHIIKMNEFSNCMVSNISLINKEDFNNLNNEIGIFGKNTRLSLYKHFSLNNNKIIVSYPDFETLTFTYSFNKYINTKTNDYIIKDNSNNYLYYDNEGNYYKYLNGKDYPTYYYNKFDNKQIQICFFASNGNLSSINGINGCNILFSYTNNKITSFTVKRILDIYDEEELNELNVYEASLIYDNDELKEITYTYLLDSNKTHRIEKDYIENENESYYIFKDSLTKEKLKIEIRENKIYSITNAKSNSFNNSRYIYLDYQQNKTRIHSNDVDNNGNYVIDNIYYYDDQNKLIYTYDSNGLIRYKEYNEDNFITYDSGIDAAHINSQEKQENLIINGEFLDGLNNFEISGSGISVINANNFPNFLSNKALHLSNSSYKEISQNINFESFSNEPLTFSLFYKYLNEGRDVDISFTFYNDDDNYTETIDLEKKYIGEAIYKSCIIKPNIIYNQITLTIQASIGTVIDIKALTLIQKSTAQIFEYDANNNIVRFESNKRAKDISYNSDNLINSTLSSYSKGTNYTYDNRGRVTEIYNNNQSKSVNIYSKKGKILRSRTYYQNEENYIEESQNYYNHISYSLDKNHLTSKNDYLNNNISYNYDYSPINHVYDKALNIPTSVNEGDKETEYKYNYKCDLKEIKTRNTNYHFQYNTASIDYNNKEDVSLYTRNDNAKFEFEYYNTQNFDGKIKSIKYQNGLVSHPLLEITYARINDIDTDNIELIDDGITQTKYEYDFDRDIKNIKIDNILKYNFEYEDKKDKKLLSKEESIIDHSNIGKEYSYDNLSRIKEIKYKNNNTVTGKIKYDYNDSYLIRKNYGSHILGYDNKAKMEGVNIASCKHYFKNRDVYSCFFENDASLKNFLLDDVIPYVEERGTYGKEGIISYIQNPSLIYNVGTLSIRNTIIIYFNGSGTIFSLGNNINNSCLYVKINDNMKLELAVNARTIQDNILFTSNEEVYNDKWNFLSLEYENISSNVFFIRLKINNEEYKYINIEDPSLEVDNGNIHIGHKYKNGTMTDYLNGKISFLYYDEIISQESTYDRYILDENIYKNIYTNEEGIGYNSVSVSNDYKNLEDIYTQDLDFFPLSSDFSSVKGKKPYKMNMVNTILLDKDPNFNYNSKMKSYNYESRGSDLIYDVNDILNIRDTEIINHIHLSIDFYVCVTFKNQVIIEEKYNTKKIIVGIDENNYIYAKIDTSHFPTNHKVTLFNNYHLTLSVNNRLAISIGSENILTITCNLDNPISMKLYVGCSSEDNYFYGQLSNLTISKDFFYASSVMKKIDEYNELNLKTSEKIVKNENIILKNNYYYDNCDERILPRVKIEKINNDIYEYEYSNNKISSIIKNGSIEKAYEYNYLGYLTKEYNYIDDIKIIYNYDLNGNIISKILKTIQDNDIINEIYYTYDNVYKDVLIRVDSDFSQTSYSYNINNPFYPYLKTKGNTSYYYNFLASNLVSYMINDLEYKYYYDSNNLRIKKELNNNNYTNYFYEGNNLIKEVVILNDTTKIIEYLYDENNKLYGFIYNNDRYYYKRNILNDIIGIVDEDGSTLCAYKYDSYGEIRVYSYNENNELVINNDNNFIGNINSFKYKGYYYDKETSLYYITSRYYDPEIGRFIQPADVSSLNPSNLNGLNLYSYANNNPIGIAYSSSSVGVSVANQLINQNPSLLIVPNLGINKNNYSSSVHWKNEWFATDWPSFLVFSKTKGALLDWGLSIYKGSLYFDEAENHSIYIGVGNISAFVGYNVEEDKYGLFADVNVLSVGYDGRYIDAGISVVGVGFILGWEDKKFRFKIDPPGWFGFDISIDFGQIIKDIFGREW